MKNITDFIFQVDTKHGTCLEFANYKDTLENAIEHSPMLRSRILLHKSTNDPIQKMLIAFDSASHVPLVSHMFTETFICVQGFGRYIIWNDETKEQKDIVLGGYTSGQVCMVVIPKNTLHRFVPISDTMHVYEITHSIFDKKYTLEPTSDSAIHLSALANQDVVSQPVSTYTDMRLESIGLHRYRCVSPIFQFHKNMISETGMTQGQIYVRPSSDPLHEKEYLLLMKKGESREMEKVVLHCIYGECIIIGKNTDVVLSQGSTCIIERLSSMLSQREETVVHVLHE